MKYAINKVILVCSVLLLSCVNKTEKRPPVENLPVKDSTVVAKPSPFTIDMVVNQKDPSCYMPLSDGIGDTAHYHGKVYGFCSKQCKEEFWRRPSYYVKD